MPRTTEDSDSCTKERIWQFSSVQSGAFRLAKSEGKLAVPARCWRLTWYLLTVVKKEVTRGLAKFLQGLNTGLAICQKAGTVLGLNYEGAKVLYGSCYRQRFNLTW